MKRTTLLSLIAIGSLSACTEHPTPVSPAAADDPQRLLTGAGVIADAYDGRPVHGAIFTTLPFGQAVNANVQYRRKIEVYLDGGPRNPNALAAGLNDGLYVFQITDPPGKNLLSTDPARCRVVQVQGGVILGTVPANRIPGLGASTDNWADNGQNARSTCHVESAEADGAGLAGRHDTNDDSDQGGGMTVQMMPFLDTPNPGGVYKAWITPLAEYVRKSGGISNLNAVPAPAKGQATGNAPDRGFANAARNNVKTDNFKVTEVPPLVRIIKRVDGVETAGWMVTIYEQIEGQWVGPGWKPTTATFAVPFNTSVVACEETRAGFAFVSATVDGSPAVRLTDPVVDESGAPIVCVAVPGISAARTIAVTFDNRRITPKARISISPPTATNALGYPHVLTGTVQVDHDLGAGWENAANGVRIDFARTSGPGTLAPAFCTTAGGTGSCSVTLTSTVVGQSVVEATSSPVVDGVAFSLRTDGTAGNSAAATKTWVGARISITPQSATNGITEPHALTGKVEINAGAPDAWVNAPAGLEIRFSIRSGPGTLTAASCNTVGATGACGTTLNSNVTGTTMVDASATVTSATIPSMPASQSIELTTNGAAGNSGPAEKIWVDGALTWRKVDGLGRPIGGATFQVRRTEDRFGSAVATPSFTVVDNDALDLDKDAGKFRVGGLALGKYCVKETVPPAGYLGYPGERCGIALTMTVRVASVGDFVNSLQGRMTGGSGKIDVTLPNGDVVSITSGFTIHCDIVLSNNIEINWPGNKWHITKPITSALCVDDPNVVPDQPDAPFDTFIGTADGALNGVAVSKISFKFVDGDGSPGGKANDRVSMTIRDAQGKVVLSFTNLPIRGNLQAHEDQPHR